MTTTTTTSSARYMSVATCATYIGRTPKAVRNLVDRSQIPYLKVGRRVQFDRERIDNWMGRHTRRGAGLP